MTHKAFITEISSIQEIPKADTIQVGIVLGTPVIVSKDYQVGHLGVFFPEGLQLSEEYCRENNLHRHSHLNKDQNQTGFFEDNRRVRAQPFMKIKSDGLFMPLSSLAYTGYATQSLKKGDQLDELNGKELCKKYISPQTQKAMNNVQKKKTKVAEAPMFHQHMDTDQFRHYAGAIPVGSYLTFHHKMHGTSARYSYSKVIRKPRTVWDHIKVAFKRYFLMEEPTESWEYLVGTRRVVLFEDQYDKEGFHGSEEFRFDWLEKLKPHLEKGLTVYGEIVGFANGSPIMAKHNTKALKDKKFTKKYGEEVVYKYGCTEDTNRFIVYRVSMTNEEGTEIDFSVEQLKTWCEGTGFEHTQEAAGPTIYEGCLEELVSVVEYLTEREDHMCEDPCDPSHPYEGVVIRVDYKGLKPKFYKSKSYAFKCMEGICEAVDVEDSN
jgi:hypothetical protein